MGLENTAGLSMTSEEGQITSGEISYATPEPVNGSTNIKIDGSSDGTKEEVHHETKSEPDTSDKKEEQADKWAKNFDKLSRKEAEIRERDNEIKAREQSIREKEKELHVLQELRTLAKEKGELAAIEALGWSTDNIVKQMLNKGKIDPAMEIDALKKEIASLREESSKGISMIEAKRKAEAWDSEFSSLLSKDEYKLVREWEGAKDWIVDHAANTFHQTGNFLNPKEELDKLTEGLKARLKKLGYMSDAQSANNPSTQANKSKESPKENKGLKTVTPKLGAAAGSTARFQMDDEDAEMARISAKYS